MGATHGICSDDSIGNGPAYIFDINNKRDIIALYAENTEVFALMSDGFIRSTSGWVYREQGIGIGDIAANNDAFTYPLIRCKHDITIVSCHIGVDSDVTEHATNYQTIYLEQSGNDNDLGTITTKTDGFSKHVPREIAVATTNDQDHLAAGDTLQLRVAKTGDGVAMYGVVVSFTFTIDQPRTTISGTDYMFRWVHDIGTGAVLFADHDQRPFLSVRENSHERLLVDNAGKIQKGESSYLPSDQYYYHIANVGQLVTADSAAKKSPILKPHCDVEIVNIFFGASEGVAIDSNTNYWQLKITDGTDILCDSHIYGPYECADALTKGKLVDMGDVNKQYAKLSSSETLCVEYAEGGTGPDTEGLTFVVCYRKVG